MNIWALPGHRVTVTESSAKNGYEYDKKIAKELIGQILTVEMTHVNSSSTDVYLKGFDNVRYNSVNFVDVDTQTLEQDRMHPDFIRWNRHG